MTTYTVETDHLRLVACSPQVARSVIGGRRQAETLLGARIHDEWPSVEIRAFLPMYAQQVERDAKYLGWGLWLIIHLGDQVVIGDVGFKGKPNAYGTVDIGYGIVTTYRQQGYGFEAARALRDWAFSQPDVRRLTADCLPENVASARILQKLGMHQIGVSDAGLLLWEMTRPDPRSTMEFHP
jgi:ribosomal-protein-alanine N-acetyltransferase